MYERNAAVLAAGPRRTSLASGRCRRGAPLRASHGAWVDLRPGWLAGADELFARLQDEVPWRAERRRMYDRVVDVPRLLCLYGDGEDAARSAAHAGQGRARRLLRGRARRAVRDRGPVPVPGRPGQRRVARRHHRPRQHRGHDRRDPVAGRAAGAGCCGRGAAAARPSGTKSATATCWSWAAAASAPGSTRYRRPRGRPGRGSACSSARTASGNQGSRSRGLRQPGGLR